MRVLMHYEDNVSSELHKTLKITLPKKWNTGPVSKLLDQFVESYNENELLGGRNPLDSASMHLEIRKPQQSTPVEASSSSNGGSNTGRLSLASDAIVAESLSDYADIYVVHGASRTKEEIEEERKLLLQEKEEALKKTVQCTRFGCQKRFPKGGPYPPNCQHHVAPPVFHETAKFWSCCPNKRAYDWETFQTIPGCQFADCCTEEKQGSDQKLFLGGTDLREQLLADSQKEAPLKSIDDFNRAQAAGGSMAVPVLQRLRAVLEEMGVEKELYQQVVEGIQNVYKDKQPKLSDLEMLEAVKLDLGQKLKTAFKSMAADQLRLK